MSGAWRNCWRNASVIDSVSVADEKRLERSEIRCSLTWAWGRDDPNGTRIDRYIGSDGLQYERIIPKGGPLCPEVQDVMPGCEPYWQLIGPTRR